MHTFLHEILIDFLSQLHATIIIIIFITHVDENTIKEMKKMSLQSSSLERGGVEVTFIPVDELAVTKVLFSFMIGVVSG